jgi:hypothetical protein
MISRLLLVPALALTLVAASATCGSSLTGPVPPGSWADGKIDGNKMSLEVTLTDSGEKLGSFTLQRGASADLTRCL